MSYALNFPVLQQELELSLSFTGTEQTSKYCIQTKQEVFLEALPSPDISAYIIIFRAGKVVLVQCSTVRDVLL